MNKNLLLLLFIVLLGAILLLLYSTDNSAVYNDSNRTTLTVSGLNCFSVDDLIESVNTNDYFEGHDNQTVMWLMTLSGNVVFASPDYYVVMSKSDADKLPVEFATDVDINDTFVCEIIENRSLGHNLSDVLYVRDVNFINQDIHYYEV